VAANASRSTQQRRAILHTLERGDRPMSPQEVLADAARHAPGLGLATVYRNLRRLLDEGVLRAIELPGAPTRYELAGKGHHHHFHCRACDRVFEVDDCPGRLADLAPQGFAVEAHEIVLYGLCRECRQPAVAACG
jgi:Fur family ferric uptake transcriptional regulator